MDEPEDLVTNKRKASPEAAEDTTGKRVKLGDGGSHNRGDEMKFVTKEQDGAQTGGSTRADSAERPTEPRHSPDARRPSATGGPPSRRTVSLEEKKRGQRLFGGLVSTLSRTTSGTQQQKRLDIERRQHERAQQRRADEEKRRAERLEQLKRTRQIEQVKLDEQVVCGSASYLASATWLTPAIDEDTALSPPGKSSQPLHTK